MYTFKVFTLREANRILPVVIDLTKEAQTRLDALRNTPESKAETSTDLDEQTRSLLNEWARLILELGAQPKGIFTVDFRSPDPNVVWCWSPLEEQISHRHFTWESFKDRVSIEPTDAGWPARN